MPSEVPANGYPLDEDQQQRILAAVLTGPVVELLGEVVRRLPQRPKKQADEASYVQGTERRLKPMCIEIPLQDTSGRAGLPWPGSGLTGDDHRRLGTLGNTTRLPSNRLLHHALHVTHHLFRSIMLEIMATHERTGTAIRDLLQVAVGEVAEEPGAAPMVGLKEASAPIRFARIAAATVAVTNGRHAAEATAAGLTEDEAPARCAAEDPTLVSFPPHPMTKPRTAPVTSEAVSGEEVQELREEMERLRESMDVLRAAVDDLREELVHSLRNVPDRLPPPLHIHSLPLDSSDPDFGRRVNAVPPDVMARLREEAAGGGGQAFLAAAAEGDPGEPPLFDAPAEARGRVPARQATLFS